VSIASALIGPQEVLASIGYTREVLTHQQPMQLTLTPELEILLQRHLNSGTYDNVTDLLLAALQLLDQQTLTWEELNGIDTNQLKQALQIGIDQADRGELLDFTTEVEAIRQRVHQRYSHQ
jgi:Arc/MetJ-type ribon-helix-helix transcriptional regulator